MFICSARGEIFLYFLECFSEGFRQDELHVDGHRQRHSTEYGVNTRDVKCRAYVRKRFQDSEHQQIGVGHQNTSADRSDGRR